MEQHEEGMVQMRSGHEVRGHKRSGHRGQSTIVLVGSLSPVPNTTIPPAGRALGSGPTALQGVPSGSALIQPRSSCNLFPHSPLLAISSKAPVVLGALRGQNCTWFSPGSLGHGERGAGMEWALGLHSQT